MIEPTEVDQALAELLGAHGIEGGYREGWFIPASGGAPLSAAIVSDRDAGANRTVQLDVRVALDDGRVLVESFGGWGPDYRQAVGRALQNFVVNSFHVLLGAFLTKPDDQVTVEEWFVSGMRWTAIIGNFGTQSGAGSAHIPQDLFETVERSIHAQRLERDLHWFRIYYANLGNGSVVSEALWDNEDWPSAAEAIAALPWEARDSFYSVRCFLVLRKIGGA